MRFTLLKTDPQSNARRGRIETGHGTIETPIFMPVGTVGSVKGVYHRDLKGDIGWRPCAWPEVCTGSPDGTARY